MKRFFIVLFFLFSFLTLFAQNKPQKIDQKKLQRIIQRRPKMNIKAIKEFAKRENLKWQKQQKVTDSLAKKMKIPKKLKDKNGNSVILWRIKNGKPEYMGFD